MQETEEQFLQKVAELARLLGWRCAHFRRGRAAITRKNRSGWATAVQFDAAGFPDLLLVRDNCIMAIELKSERGRLSSTQREWLLALSQTNALVFVFKPSDWEDIIRCLSNDPQITNTVKGM